MKNIKQLDKSIYSNIIVSMVNRAQKEQIVKEVKAKLKGAKLAILSDFTGLKNSQIEELRSQMREQSIEYEVIKKKLLKRAGLDIDYQGSIALAVSKDDEIMPAKILYNNKVKIISGVLDGKAVDLTILEEFAKLPSREELLHKFNSILRNNINKLILILRNPTGFRSIDYLKN